MVNQNARHALISNKSMEVPLYANLAPSAGRSRSVESQQNLWRLVAVQDTQIASP